MAEFEYFMCSTWHLGMQGPNTLTIKSVRDCVLQICNKYPQNEWRKGESRYITKKQHPVTGHFFKWKVASTLYGQKCISNVAHSVLENPDAVLYYTISKEVKYVSFSWTTLGDICVIIIWRCCINCEEITWERINR